MSIGFDWVQLVGVLAVSSLVGLGFALWPLEILHWVRPAADVPDTHLKVLRVLGGVMVACAASALLLALAIAIWMPAN